MSQRFSSFHLDILCWYDSVLIVTVAIYKRLRSKYAGRMIPPGPSITGEFLEKFVALLRIGAPCILNPVPIFDSFLEQFVQVGVNGMTREETIREYKTVHQSPELFLELITPHVAFDDMMMYLYNETRRTDCPQGCPLQGWNNYLSLFSYCITLSIIIFI